MATQIRLYPAIDGTESFHQEPTQFQTDFTPRYTPCPAIPARTHKTVDDSSHDTDFERLDPTTLTHKEAVLKTMDASIYGPVGTRDATINWFKQTQLKYVKIFDLMNETSKIADWFHGIITRKEAETLLEHKQLGCFLIRVSESRLGYTLSFRDVNRCRHYMIDYHLSSQDFNIVGETTKHMTLQDLVNFYKKNTLSNWTGYLTTPCKQGVNQCDYLELIITPQEERTLDYIWRRPRLEASAPDLLDYIPRSAINLLPQPLVPQSPNGYPTGCPTMPSQPDGGNRYATMPSPAISPAPVLITRSNTELIQLRHVPYPNTCIGNVNNNNTSNVDRSPQNATNPTRNNTTNTINTQPPVTFRKPRTHQGSYSMTNCAINEQQTDIEQAKLKDDPVPTESRKTFAILAQSINASLASLRPHSIDITGKRKSKQLQKAAETEPGQNTNNLTNEGRQSTKSPVKPPVAHKPVARTRRPLPPTPMSDNVHSDTSDSFTDSPRSNDEEEESIYVEDSISMWKPKNNEVKSRSEAVDEDIYQNENGEAQDDIYQNPLGLPVSRK